MAQKVNPNAQQQPTNPPKNPTLGQTITQGDTSYSWNGNAWEAFPTANPPDSGGANLTTNGMGLKGALASVGLEQPGMLQQDAAAKAKAKAKTATTSTAPAATNAAASNPFITSGQFDPLAMQNLMANVCAPYLNSIAGMQNNAAGEYGSAMNAALAGYNGPDKSALQSDANATQSLISAGQNAAQESVANNPLYDNLIAQLQQATGAAQLYKGEAERDVAYGTNNQFASAVNGSSTGTGTASPTAQATAAQIAQALAAQSPATTTPSVTTLPTQSLSTK